MRYKACYRCRACGTREYLLLPSDLVKAKQAELKDNYDPSPPGAWAACHVAMDLNGVDKRLHKCDGKSFGVMELVGAGL